MKLRTYVITEEMKVNIFPKITEKLDMKQVLKEAQQTSDRIVAKTEYPSGLIMNTDVTSGKLVLTTNWVIVKGENGELLIAEPYSPEEI
jgi:hypothetical protein